MRNPFLALSASALAVFAAGCINPINPLGKFDPTPKVAAISPVQPEKKFAWGISTASYQYEDPAVKPGDADYFTTDWDVLVAHKKAPPRGNALYSWSDFDKDIAALKKIRPTHYRFSIEWHESSRSPAFITRRPSAATWK